MSKLFLYFCFPISKRFHNFSAELKKINIFGFLRRLNFFGGDIICETHLASTNQMWSHMLPSLVKYRHAKCINLLLPEILLIKESYNLIGQEVHLANTQSY